MKQKKTLLTISLVIVVFISLSFNGYSQETNIPKIKQEIAEKGIKEFINEIDKSPSVNKAENIRLLGELKYPRLVKPIIDKFLKDKSENEQVRSAAAYALGEINDQSALKPLIKSLRKDNSVIVRLEAAAALGKIGSPLVVKPLIEALKKDEDNKVREVSAVELTRIKDLSGVESLIKILYLKDDNLSQIYAIKALGMAKEVRAVTRLNTLVGPGYNRPLEVKIEAVKALGEIKDPSSIRPIQDAFKSNQFDLQKEAGKVLYKYGVMNLRNAVFTSRSESVEEAGKEALVSIGAPAVEQLYRFDPLLDFMIEALGEIDSPKAIDLLIQSLKSPSDSYRKKIEASLLIIGEPVGRPLAKVRMDVDSFLLDSKMMSYERKEISKKLKTEIDAILEKLDYTPSQDEQATYFILNLKQDELRKMGKSAIQSSLTLLNDNDPKIRAKAITAMGEIKDPAFVQPLINALKNDESFKVRIQAAKILGEIKDPVSIEPLIYSLKNDSNDKVQQQAASALGKMKDNRAIEPLISAAKEDSTLYYSAFGALLNINAENPPAIKFYFDALQGLRGYSSQLLWAANIIVASKNPIPVKARKLALSHIANFTTLTEIMDYSEFGKPVSLILKNVEGKEVAKRKFVYSQANSNQITSEILEDLTTGTEIHVTNYNKSGQPINQRYMCFDNKGNIIKKEGKVILLKKSIAQRRTELITTYSLGYKERKTSTIYPSENGPSLTGVKNCKYVW